MEGNLQTKHIHSALFELFVVIRFVYLSIMGYNSKPYGLLLKIRKSYYIY